MVDLRHRFLLVVPAFLVERVLNFEVVSDVDDLNHDEILVLLVVCLSKNLHLARLRPQILAAVILNHLHHELHIENHLR